jgi:hypothetical protein
MQLADSINFKGQVKWIKTIGGILVAESPWMDNQVLANAERGIYLFLDRLAGITLYSGTISHADIGDDDTAASASDTGCINPLERASVGAMSRNANTATFRFFYADATTANDTYEEFAMFVDGNSTPGNGRAFNRIVMAVPLVKSAGEDHTIVCRITGSV